MNPLYTILESKYRWLSLAGICFTAGCVGAMMMLALTWKHGVALAWLYLGLLATLFFGIRAFLEWKSAAEQSLAAQEQRSKGRKSAE